MAAPGKAELVDNRLQLVTQLIHLLDQRGWDATTADELAAAAGISRATFFRVYGSKEDLVFADHSVMLTRLETFLAETDHDVASAMREGLMLVFRYHLDDQERTLARHRLLKQSVQLRNRELLTSHHYERIFRHWLGARLREEGVSESVAVALAGAAVALHNSFLRQWLAQPRQTILDDFQQEAQRLIRVFLAGYRSDNQDDPTGSRSPRPVTVVTVVNEGSDTEQVCEAVRIALNEQSLNSAASAQTAVDRGTDRDS